ncbi:DUF3105 domain-containing protein [Haloarcula salinisoli]|uniref:DUF3105 domain-containing protein n=1 Tax=Haloarcula salinisoli TaxID=2487746 RepID=A0A8J7YLA5_9EURY|nr:DUF3105 domain-containing protein [Halomicroarcula salinisoli]MBX0286541.1 DUF3105 domain-containing protein [Halomicroarcula salinisoli]MBX0303891.1 DUF3105 domain-containing protein [Halomicroarcula salinisoli]
MVDCDYCEASFDGEDAYLDHLADDHDGELGAIDQRRVDSRKSDDESGISLMALAVGIGVAIAIGATLYLSFFSGGGGSDGVSPDGIESESLKDSGDSETLSAVEQFPNEGTQHVSESQNIDYEQSPPLSGPHYDRPTEGGFYEESQPAGNIVHSLEHGAVVIYYDDGALNESSRTSLQEFAQTHTGTWRSVIVLPNPNESAESDFVLTAWRNRMYMDSYDAQTVYEFLSEFLGRGPENPVR